ARNGVFLCGPLRTSATSAVNNLINAEIAESYFFGPHSPRAFSVRNEKSILRLRQLVELQRRQRDLCLADIAATQILDDRLLHARVNQHTLVTRVLDYEMSAVLKRLAHFIRLK